MTKCCWCNSSGRCKNCRCAKRGVECKNCNPRNHGRCMNGKSSPLSHDSKNASKSSVSRSGSCDSLSSNKIPMDQPVTTTLVCDTRESLEVSRRSQTPMSYSEALQKDLTQCSSQKRQSQSLCSDKQMSTASTPLQQTNPSNAFLLVMERLWITQVTRPAGVYLLRRQWNQ